MNEINSSQEIIFKTISELLCKKYITDFIDFETDNIFNKSGVSNMLRKFIDKNCLYNLSVLKDYNILLKFVPVNNDYKCYESISFTHKSLVNIIIEKWNSNDDIEISYLRKILDNTIIFVPIIKSKSKGIYNNYNEWRIGELSAWKPNDRELELIGEEWRNVKAVINDGIVLKKSKFGMSYRTTNNLPKQSETNFIHLRPHGKDSHDYDKQYYSYTMDKVKITKQSFWLNKGFINNLLSIYRWN
jgi:hypothetical protein